MLVILPTRLRPTARTVRHLYPGALAVLVLLVLLVLLVGPGPGCSKRHRPKQRLDARRSAWPRTAPMKERLVWVLHVPVVSPLPRPSLLGTVMLERATYNCAGIELTMGKLWNWVPSLREMSVTAGQLTQSRATLHSPCSTLTHRSP